MRSSTVFKTIFLFAVCISFLTADCLAAKPDHAEKKNNRKTEHVQKKNTQRNLVKENRKQNRQKTKIARQDKTHKNKEHKKHEQRLNKTNKKKIKVQASSDIKKRTSQKFVAKIEKLNNRDFSNNAPFEMLVPFGHGKDSDRKELYGNNGRPLRITEQEPEPTPEPVPEEPAPEPEPEPEPTPEPEPEPIPEPEIPF